MNRPIDIPKLKEGNRAELSKAITLIEDSRPEKQNEAQTLLKTLIPFSGKSLRIAVTGIPGAGKSTFLEALGMKLVSENKKVAVLAIDPSGPQSGGSILGDKTRMEKLSVHPKAFVRPSPSSGLLGGVARKTRESVILCEAAGYNIIFIETVGVGQSEVEVSHMADLVLLILPPNTGDDLQGIKRGIMEVADVIAINKADGPSLTLAEVTKSHIKNALTYFSHSPNQEIPVHLCSSLEEKGIDDIWNDISKICQNKDIVHLRHEQEKYWFKQLVWDTIELQIKSNSDLQKKWVEFENKISKGEITPIEASDQFVKLFINDKFSSAGIILK